MLESIEINCHPQPEFTVIWLHGLGADGNDFVPVVSQLEIEDDCPIRFVFPHAPIRSVTINMGMQMRAWYDILNPVLGNAEEDREGIELSCDQVSELIANENNMGIPAKRIVLAGFSQGGAIALHLGLRYQEKLAGILALSTYLPLSNSAKSETNAVNLQTSILYLHGLFDPVIPMNTANRSRKILQDLGCNVESRDYPIPHSVSPEEIGYIGKWLTDRCKSSTISQC